MNFEDFKKDALRTESRPEVLNFTKAGLSALLDIGVQTAHLLDTAKKTMFYGKPLDVEAMREQLFALAALAMETHVNANCLALGAVDDEALHAPNLRIAHGAIGMFGESGELLEAVLKQVKTGKLDLVNTAEELGDAFWYAAILADESGVSFEQAQETVVKKLKARYGAKFSSEAALTRDLVAERSVLEESLKAPV